MVRVSALMIALVIVVAPCFASPALAQPPATVERAFTSLDLKQCRHSRGTAAEDYGSWRCAGFAGVAVLVRAGDQRSYVSYGSNAAREPAAAQTLASFNSEGRTIEWRFARGAGGKPRPFATILRWNTTKLDDSANSVRGQVLVVTRLGPGSVCHVGYVDGRANRNANELAQQIADNHARKFKCGADKPVVLGIRGKGFSGPYGDAQ